MAKLKKGLSIKQLLLYGLIGFGAYQLIKGMFGKGGNDESTLPPCIANIPDATMAVGTGGVVVVQIPDGIDEKSRGHKGLSFWPNMRVISGDLQVRGTYSCIGESVTTEPEKGGHIPGSDSTPPGLTQLSEQEDPLNANMDDIEGKYSNIKVVWDADKTQPGGTTPGGATPGKSKYHPCASFPFQIGCKNDMIKEMQICLEFPAKYQTGNFGPITKAKLIEWGFDLTNGITQEIYDAVKKHCTDNVNTTPARTNTEPVAPLAGGTNTNPTVTSANTTNPGDKLQKRDNALPVETAEETYQRLGSKLSHFGNRLRYKEDELLSQQELNNLTAYLRGQGYEWLKSDEARNGGKYVWKKVR